MPESKTILITGASRGIGLEATKSALLKGWKVIGTTRNTPFPDDISNHPDFKFFQIDLSKKKEVDVLAGFLSDNFQIDVLVNNAGIFEPVLFTDEDDVWETKWQTMLEVNLKAPAKLCKKAVQNWMDKGREGFIINVSSRAAYRGETAQYSSYAAAKAGLVGLTKTIARGFGRNHIYAYTIAPGFVHTDMAEESIEVYGKDYLTKDLALDAIAPPTEVGELITTLASGSFKHMTGSTLHINSGSYMI